MDIINTEPVFVIKTVLAKSAKICLHLASFLMLFIVANSWNKAFRQSVLQNVFSKINVQQHLVFGILLVAACSPGILILPSRYYIPAGLALILLNCAHLSMGSSQKQES